MRDREVCSTRCPLCHKNAKRKIRWFSANQKRSYSLSCCETHGYVKGKIRIKKTQEQNYYIVKTLKPVDENDAEEIRRKQENIRQKRKQRRKIE